MVAKPEDVKPLEQTFWYFTKEGEAWKNMPSKGGWTQMKTLSSGYYRIYGNLYSKPMAIWRSWVGPVEHGFTVRLKDPSLPMHLDNLEVVKIIMHKPDSKKARLQREALVRSNLRRAVEVENLLLSTWAKHSQQRHSGTYRGCLLLQQEYEEIIKELKELGVNYLEERERREPCYIP